MGSWYCISRPSLETRAYRDPFSCPWPRLPRYWAAYLALNWSLKASSHMYVIVS